MDWLNITMKTTTELFVTAYNIILRRIPYYVWSFCGSPGPGYSNVHWVGHYPVEKF